MVWSFGEHKINTVITMRCVVEVTVVYDNPLFFLLRMTELRKLGGKMLIL